MWLVASSFKTPAGLLEFPPTFLPYTQETVEVPGFDEPLPLYEVTLEDGTTERLAQVRRIGLQAQMVDPAAIPTRRSPSGSSARAESACSGSRPRTTPCRCSGSTS